MVLLPLLLPLSSPSKPSSSTAAADGGQEGGTGMKLLAMLVMMVGAMMLMNGRRTSHHRHRRGRRHARQIPSLLRMHKNQGTSRCGPTATASSSSAFSFSFFRQEQPTPAPSVPRVVLRLRAAVSAAAQPVGRRSMLLLLRLLLVVVLLLLLLGQPVELEADEPLVGLPMWSLLEERGLKLLLLLVVVAVVVTAAAAAAAIARAPAWLLPLASSHGERIVLPRLHGLAVVCHWLRREGWAHSSPAQRPTLFICVCWFGFEEKSEKAGCVVGCMR